jgi:hypothetical protein
MRNSSPIAIFAYNRSEHVENLIESLCKNYLSANSSVVVFIDGPKNDFDEKQQSKIFNYLKGDFPFKSLEIRASSYNKGLADSIRSGVSKMLEENSRVIVLEDDLVLSSTFLDYMNEALDFYENQPKVASIHGFQYPLKHSIDKPVFFRGADCWGWATWSDRWATVSFDSEYLLKQIKDSHLIDSFNLDGGMNYYGMLQSQASGKVDSWAICWHASMYIQEKLTLFPPASLVKNNGNDGSGVHSGVNNFFETEIIDETSWEFPIHIEESELFRKLLGDFYYRSLGRKNIIIRIYRKIRRLIG